MRKLTLEERAQRRQRRLYKRRLADMPLFVATGIADEVQPIPNIEQIKRDLVRWKQDVIDRIEGMKQKNMIRAKVYRNLVAGHVSFEELSALDERRLIYPATPEYAAYFWHKVYDEL